MKTPGKPFSEMLSLINFELFRFELLTVFRISLQLTVSGNIAKRINFDISDLYEPMSNRDLIAKESK